MASDTDFCGILTLLFLPWDVLQNLYSVQNSDTNRNFIGDTEIYTYSTET